MSTHLFKEIIYFQRVRISPVELRVAVTGDTHQSERGEKIALLVKDTGFRYEALIKLRVSLARRSHVEFRVCKLHQNRHVNSV
jgi:hypothetical protein